MVVLFFAFAGVCRCFDVVWDLTTMDYCGGKVRDHGWMMVSKLWLLDGRLGF